MDSPQFIERRLLSQTLSIESFVIDEIEEARGGDRTPKTRRPLPTHLESGSELEPPGHLLDSNQNKLKPGGIDQGQLESNGTQSVIKMSYNNNNNQVSDSMERGVVVRDGSGVGLRGRFDNGGPIRNSPFKNGPPGTGGSGNKVAPLNEIVEQIMPLEGNQFEVFWQNLSYVVERFQISDLIKKRDEGRIKTIIRNMNGRFRSGEICAIMGPSGAGKSTLLECVAGKRRKGMSGEVFIRGGINIKVRNDQRSS